MEAVCQLGANKILENFMCIGKNRSKLSEVFFRKGLPKICSKFTGEWRCQSAIQAKLLCSFIKIALWHGCSPANLLHIFRIPFPKSTSGRLLLKKETFCTCGHLQSQSRNTLLPKRSEKFPEISWTLFPSLYTS